MPPPRRSVKVLAMDKPRPVELRLDVFFLHDSIERQ